MINTRNKIGDDMKLFELIRKLTIYGFCIGGWGLLYYLVISASLQDGELYITVNSYDEMWFELILMPIILTVLIIFIILEVKK